MSQAHTPVLIAGAGPAGLALATELGWRGIACALVARQRPLCLNATALVDRIGSA